MTFAYQKIKSVATWRTFPVFVTVFFFPKQHIGPESMLMFDAPDFFMNEVWAYPPYVGVYLMLTCIIGYLMYRSLFVLHVLLLEGGNMIDALRRSWYITGRMGYVRMLVMLMRSAILAFLFTIPTYLVVLLLIQMSTMSTDIL